MKMKQLRKAPLLQMMLIMTLVLLTYQKKNATSSNQKQKKSGGKRCKDCISVRVDNPLHPNTSVFSTRGLKERGIVTFDYHIVDIANGIEDWSSGGNILRFEGFIHNEPLSVLHRHRVVQPSNISNPGGIPNQIQEVKCSKTCRGQEMDMNVVPIKRRIHYLKKEKNIYVLKEITVTVGCTCVYPDIREQKMT